MSRVSLALTLLLAAVLAFAGAAGAAEYELVLRRGRVIDPETQLDAVRDVGISDGRVQALARPGLLRGERVVDVTGLVVAPGFIDTHSHGMTIPSQIYQVRDGVTTALELEAGGHPVRDFLLPLRDRARIHYGASTSYLEARAQVKGSADAAFRDRSTDAEIADTLARVEAGLDDGGLGIGLPLDYVSSAVDERELRALFELASRRGVPLFIHIRRPPTAGDPAGLREVIELARATGAPIQVCHIGSSASVGIEEFLDLMRAARTDGVDISTETYPYTAGSTFIGAAVFDRDWQRIYGITYADIEWPPTGERFTEQTWEEYRLKYRGDRNAFIIHHFNKEEFLEIALADPLVMIATDGMPLSSLTQRQHPRGMGTFSRVLGRYVRERGILSLQEAIRKMTLMPAQRLESIAPEMKRKGRIQAGSDADITIFDAATVRDRATFRNPSQFSEGIVHVLVAGRFVVRDAALVEGSRPGKPIFARAP